MAKRPSHNFIVEHRVLGRIETRTRAKAITLHLSRADLRHAIKGLNARALWLARRKEPDEVLKQMGVAEAKRCATTAMMLQTALKGAK